MMHRLLRVIVCCAAIANAQSGAAGAKPAPDTDLEDRWRVALAESKAAVPATRFPYAHCFRRAAKVHGVSQGLLIAVARGESAFDPQARSNANAYGLMQIQWPQTARHLGIQDRQDLLDPCTNVDAGARYLKQLLQRYQGNAHRALAAYNYGPSRIAVDSTPLPKGAAWYSGYVFRHLDFVLRNSTDRELREVAAAPTPGQQILVTRFLRPYRAAALVAHLQPAFGSIRIDWFRRPAGGFDVVMLAESSTQLQQGRRLLAQWGFAPQEDPL